MMNTKKPRKDSPSTNDGVQKTKAFWDHKSTENFVKACLGQVSKGERVGTSFTKKGWKGIITRFHELTGRKYEKAQLKNRYDSLRKDWRAWYNLFGRETGLGWDPVNNTVVAPDEWWESKQLENPLYAKFRYKGLPFAHELTTLFKDVVANGEYTWAPSCGVLPCQVDNDDNDENGVVAIEEGSGDSEDASIGTTTEFANIALNSSQKTDGQKSGEKRKRVVGASKPSKKKATATSKIAEAVSLIAETCRSRNDAAGNASIGEVMAELQTMDEVSNDLEWHAQCCQLMMFKPAREIFISLRGSEEKRMNWLRHAANNPLPFMNL